MTITPVTEPKRRSALAIALTATLSLGFAHGDFSAQSKTVDDYWATHAAK